MIPVGRLAPKDQWDQTLLDDLFDNKLYPTGLKFKRVEGYPNAEGCCLLIPSRYWHQHTDQISEAISRYDWCLGFRVGDEEDDFRVEDVVHPNVRWWVQTPRPGVEYPLGTRFIGVGYSPHFRELPAPVKDTDVFLAAQRSNGLKNRHYRLYERRDEFFKVLGRGSWVKNLVPRDGFAQGDRAEYVKAMLAAKVAPAPCGNISVDSFRFWEALEAGCVPIADTVSQADGPTEYWEQLFGDWVPFPLVTDPSELPALVTQTLADWPAISNRVQAWWMRYKRSLAMGLREDLEALGAL